MCTYFSHEKQNTWNRHFKASTLLHFLHQNHVKYECILHGNIINISVNTAGNRQTTLFWVLWLKRSCGLLLVCIKLWHLTFSCPTGAAQCPTTKHCSCTDSSHVWLCECKAASCRNNKHEAYLAEKPWVRLRKDTAEVCGLRSAINGLARHVEPKARVF